jgi:hypothetical protein
MESTEPEEDTICTPRTINKKVVKRRGWHLRAAYPWKTMFSLTLSSRNGLAMLYRILKILKGILKKANVLFDVSSNIPHFIREELSKI